MIIGIGTDIVEVSRIRDAMERFGDRFIHRLLTPSESGYCHTQRDAAPHIAARFAAKEAISKAFGTGIGQHLGWQDMEIARHPSGEPYLVLHGKGLVLMQARQGRRVHITLSHTKMHATSVALLEG